MRPRVLIVTLPERGHYHPLLAPAAALARRGAEVAFACSWDIARPLAALGMPRHPARLDTPTTRPAPRSSMSGSTASMHRSIPP